MSMFRLVYDEADARACGHAVALEAEHANAAIGYLASHYASKPVELWCDGEYLGHIKRAADHGAKFWRVLA